MNLIYVCVSHQQSYIKLLKLLINSISLKGNINKDTTDILIITSKEFYPFIQKDLEGFGLPICYYIVDVTSLMESSCCKLKIFSYNKKSVSLLLCKYCKFVRYILLVSRERL